MKMSKNRLWQFFMRDLTMHFSHHDYEMADDDLDQSIHDMKKLPQFALESGSVFSITFDGSRVTLKVDNKDYGVIIDNVTESTDLYPCITFSRYGKSEGDKIRVLPQYAN